MDKAQRDKSMGINSRRRSSIKLAVNKIDPRNEGVIFLGIKKLFAEIEADTDASYCVRMSYVEIYNENVFDLLAIRGEVKGSLQIVENTKSNDFWIRGVNEIIIADAEEAIDLIMSGEENRHFAATALNHHSSRSHCLIRLFVKKITSDESIFEGICNFVDLAGSEKLSGMLEDKRSAAKGHSKEVKSISDRLQESKHINKSLFFLTQIIYMKSRMTKAFIPYRNSALTKILKNSIGGNARTTIILCVNPLFRTLAETLSTLRFGQRAKKIVNTVTKNESKEGDVDALKKLVGDYEKKIKEMELAMKNGVQSLRQSFGPRKSNLVKLIENLQNQKGMLEKKLLRRSSILNMFKKSKFAPVEESATPDQPKVKKSIVNFSAGVLDFYGTNAVSNNPNQLSNRKYVKEALQSDFVRNVKKRNSELERKLKDSENKRDRLKEKYFELEQKLQKTQDLVDMLINKKPEMTLKLDPLSRDLLINNASISIQNLSLVQTISKAQMLGLHGPSQIPVQPGETHPQVREFCSKVGFQYSGTYLTRGNLEVQVFGKEESKRNISSIYESKKHSILQKRLTQKIQGAWRGRQMSSVTASNTFFNQSILSQTGEPLESKLTVPKKQTNFGNFSPNRNEMIHLPKLESKEEVSQNILLSKQSTANKISLTGEDKSILLNMQAKVDMPSTVKGTPGAS